MMTSLHALDCEQLFELPLIASWSSREMPSEGGGMLVWIFENGTHLVTRIHVRVKEGIEQVTTISNERPASAAGTGCTVEVTCH